MIFQIGGRLVVTMSEIIDNITTSATKGLRSVRNSAATVEEHPLRDRIEADRYLRAAKAADAVHPATCLRIALLRMPAAICDTKVE